ncbi:retrovirus-related pol polyprotein from transposon TNT 1-94 [Tanacetum coccineum]|uniref:Retrovirus-related pol polyprotein from transposon TNT 1-94 n=1 Tax=Tanacetum coccineum TaxID=301880 RepID=A0ABQ5FBT7_9ASTR
MLKFLQHQLFRSLEDWEVSSLQCMQRLRFKFEGDNTPIVIQPPCYSASKDFQDSPDDEEDTRISQEYLNDLEKEYQERALLAKSKRFFKKEEVSSDDNEMVEVKVLMALAEENDVVSKEGARNGEWVKISMRKVHTLLEMEDNDDRKVCLDYLCIDLNYVEEQRSNLLSKHRNLVHELNACKEQLLVLKQAKLDFLTIAAWLKDLVFVKSSANDTKVTIPGVERPWLSKAKGFILPNHDTGRILPSKSQRNTTDPSVVVIDSSATEYNSADESLVCSTPLPPLKKLDGVEPISGPKTIKSILRSKSTLKTEALKGVIINEPSSAPAKDNKSSSASKVHSAHAGKLKSVKIKDDPSLAIVMKELNRRPNMYLTVDAQGHMTSRQSYLHKYVEQPGPKVVFGDDSTCTTEGYGSIKCNGIIFTKITFVNGLKYNLISISQLCHAKYIVQFDEKRGTIFNSNKEIVMIAPRVRDVYVLDMTSSAQESCFFAKAFENLNWLWHKRLAHLNFKTINKLAKQNLVIGLPSLKCLHLLHMDLFGPVTPKSINHEKYTLVIVDEYSRNSTLVNFCDEKGISQNFSSPYTPKQNGVAERKNRTLIEAARTMLSGSVFSKQYWTEARIPNISFLHVFGGPVYIHNHKDQLGKFDEKADDGYLLRYSLVSKAFRVFNTRRQQTEETYHITFDESPEAIKFSKPLVDNISIAESERYPPDEYLYPYEPSQRYQTNSNEVSFIETYECPKPVVLETEVSSDQNDQTDQNDQPVQNDEILNDDHSEHSNHTNDEQIIDSLSQTLNTFRYLNTCPIQIQRTLQYKILQS